MKLLDRIKLLHSLTPSEELLREYIIEHFAEMIFVEEEKLKQELYISSSSIYRFCQKLEIKGYGELRILLTQEFIKSRKEVCVNYNFPFTKNDPIMKINDNLSQLYIETIEITQSSLDEMEIKKAISILERAKNICFFTSNMNTQIAEKFRAQMKEIGKDIQISSSPYKWKLDSINLTSEDALIINSYAGHSSKQFTKILPELAMRKVPVILIGSAKNKTLMPYASSALLMCDKEHPSEKLYSFSSNLSTLYILDLLYAGLYQENYSHNFANHQYLYSE